MKKIRCEACPIRAQSPLCNLPDEALEELQAAGVTSLYKPRQVVFAEGNPAAGLHILCAGAVKLYHSDRFGKDHVLQVVPAGAILGELSDDPAAAQSVSAEAVVESQLTFIPTERLVPFLRRHPETGLRLLMNLSSELAGTRRKVRDLALKGAEARLASLLLELIEAENGAGANGHLNLPYSRRDLAEMIGVSTETAIRLLAALRRKGILRVERRDIAITDLDRLRKIAVHDELE